MTKLGWSMVAGLGVAGLLVASPLARAQSGSSTQNPQGTGSSGTTSSGTGSSGTKSSGTGSSGTTSSGTGSSGTTSSGTGSSGTASSGTGSSDTAASGTGSSSTAGASASASQVTGKIKKYDKDSKTVTLDSSDRKLKLSEKTKVMKDGAKASMSDLKEGENVRASYAPTADQTAPIDVLTIEVMPADATGTTSPGTQK
jgi:Cu/Ag efflux protein CusF